MSSKLIPHLSIFIKRAGWNHKERTEEADIVIIEEGGKIEFKIPKIIQQAGSFIR